MILALPALAQEDSALLNALVKKGVLSDKEAQDIQVDEQKDYNTTGASKIVLSSAIKTIQFYGDIRLRYEIRDGTTPAGAIGSNSLVVNHNGTADSQTSNRWRYRLRFGVKGDLYDDFFYGIRAATNNANNRSDNVTFGASDGAGPFGKDRSLLALDQVYLGWHATPDLTLIGGQMPNPLYTTNMVWDDNINPAGAAEQWNHTFDDVNVFATAGQFIYQAASGNGITNTVGGAFNYPNTFMYAEQVGFNYKIDKTSSFKAAATLYTYSGTDSNNETSVASLYSTTAINLAAPNNNASYFNGPFVGASDAPTANDTGINDLEVIELPLEYDFVIGDDAVTPDPKDVKDVKVDPGWSIPIRIFGDLAYNLQASERADQAAQEIEGAEAQNFVGSKSTGNVGVTLNNSGAAAAAGGVMTAADVANNKTMFNSPNFKGVLHSGKGFLDQAAFQIGVEAGQLKKKGDWDGKLYYQSTGYYALDPNLVSGNFFSYATNLNGPVASVSHEWTDGLTSTLTYAYATQVNDQLATPNTSPDLTLGEISHYNLFQADLEWKF